MKDLKKIAKALTKKEQSYILGGLRRCNNGVCFSGFCCQGLCVPSSSHWAYNHLCG